VLRLGAHPASGQARRAGGDRGRFVDRGYPGCGVEDFLKSNVRRDNIVCNPLFDRADIMKPFIEHALNVTTRKVAMIFPVARMNAARWMHQTPLRAMWLLTPRPSMPPASYLAAGNRPGGGRVDFCWLVWEHGYPFSPKLRWLDRRRRALPASGAH
jgi:hypothetical protein